VIEDQLADRMRAALAEKPPLGFDPDEVADRATRLRRRRRSSFAAAGGTAAVLGIAVTAAVVSGAGGRGSEVGTQVSSSPTASIAPNAPCTGVGEGERPPPLDFAGSAPVVARLDAAGPRVIAEHLPGVSVEPSETGMIAYDCPPNVGTLYRVSGADQTVMLYLIHSGTALDLGNDRYAEDRNYHLVGEESAADGARIRTYEYSGGPKPGVVLVVVRFGLDGMITEASLSGQGELVAGRAELLALASDPELRF
jgi:hypothetical protein